jgi:hypothetical protein
MKMKRTFVIIVGLFSLLIAGNVNAYNCTGLIFNDVNSSTVGDAFCGFIEEFSILGITGGCSVSPPLYCPFNYVTREQMAVFITAAHDKVKPKRVAVVSQTGGGDYTDPATAMTNYARLVFIPIGNKSLPSEDHAGIL